jgi:hypothetical protein
MIAANFSSGAMKTMTSEACHLETAVFHRKKGKSFGLPSMNFSWPEIKTEPMITLACMMNKITMKCTGLEEAGFANQENSMSWKGSKSFPSTRLMKGWNAWTDPLVGLSC